MMRIKATTRRRRVAPVDWGAAVPVRDQQPSTAGVRGRAHKERIIELLVAAPEGMTLVDLAAELGLTRGSTYPYVSQLQAQGLIDKFGSRHDTRWIALV